MIGLWGTPTEVTSTTLNTIGIARFVRWIADSHTVPTTGFP